MSQNYSPRWRLFLFSFGLLAVAIIAIAVVLIAFPKTSPPASPIPTCTTTPPPVITLLPSLTTEVASTALSYTPTSTASPTATAGRPLSTLADGSFVATPIPLGSREVTDFMFVVCGDNRGGDDVYLEILRRVEEDGAVFFVNTGDLVNYGTADEFQHFADLMSDFTIPFFPVAGNHDSPDGLLDEFLEYSGAPARHYSFDYGPGHFVVVDSHLGVLWDSELDWLEADLSSTDQLLKVVFIHHPPFDPDGTDHIMRQGNEKFMTLVEEYGVSYVFTGHIHAYVEGFRNDVHYIITGGAGAPLYGADHPNAFYHYIRVRVQGTEITTEIIQVEP